MKIFLVFLFLLSFAGCEEPSARDLSGKIKTTAGTVIDEDSFFGTKGKKVDIGPILPILKTATWSNGFSMKKGYFTVQLDDGTILKFGQFSASFEVDGVNGEFTIPGNLVSEYSSALSKMLGFQIKTTLP